MRANEKKPGGRWERGVFPLAEKQSGCGFSKPIYIARYALCIGILYALKQDPWESDVDSWPYVYM